MLFVLGVVFMLLAFIAIIAYQTKHINFAQGVASVSALGLIGVLFLIAFLVQRTEKLVEEDCQGFNNFGRQAYVVKGVCYVEISPNLFMPTRAETPELRSKAWIESNKKGA